MSKKYIVRTHYIRINVEDNREFDDYMKAYLYYMSCREVLKSLNAGYAELLENIDGNMNTIVHV